MKIICEFDTCPALWIAVTDEYDGAPDAGWPSNCTGYGQTKQAAIDDLLEQLEDDR